MTIAETRVHRAVTLMLKDAQQNRRKLILSGPPGIGLSYSASAFVALDKTTRVLARATSEAGEDVAAKLVSWLAPADTLFYGYSPEIYAEPPLIVVDQIENFRTAGRLEQFSSGLMEKLQSLNPGIVLIGGDKLRLPQSNFEKLDERSLLREWATEHFDLFSFSMDQLSVDDLKQMALSKGASEPLAAIVARLCDYEAIPASYHHIERAVRKLAVYPDLETLKLPEARRLLLD